MGNGRGIHSLHLNFKIQMRGTEERGVGRRRGGTGRMRGITAGWAFYLLVPETSHRAPKGSAVSLLLYELLTPIYFSSCCVLKLRAPRTDCLPQLYVVLPIQLDNLLLRCSSDFVRKVRQSLTGISL